MDDQHLHTDDPTLITILILGHDGHLTIYTLEREREIERERERASNRESSPYPELLWTPLHLYSGERVLFVVCRSVPRADRVDSWRSLLLLWGTLTFTVATSHSG